MAEKLIGPNKGKKLVIKVEGNKYWRFPIKTEVFKKGDDYVRKISRYFTENIKILAETKNLDDGQYFLVVAEKIVAIAQGRSYFLKEINPGFWAKFLSNYVTKTPYGIGLGSPWTMELAIKEIGLVRILLATMVAAVTRPFGIKGLFYKIAGQEAAAIDGPTAYSLYPSNMSAKLGPKDPQQVADKIKSEILNPKSQINSKFKISHSNFLGVVIIDANDLGQKVLGNSTGLDNQLIEKIFSDNPMGQADEQTPMVIVVRG